LCCAIEAKQGLLFLVMPKACYSHDKRSKKLLFMELHRGYDLLCQMDKSFLLLFFKKEALLPAALPGSARSPMYRRRTRGYFMADAISAGDPREEAILGIVAHEANIDRSLLVPEATIAQLGIASIDLTLAVFELEKHFGIEIPVVATAQGAEFTTVGDLVGHVLSVLDRRVTA